MALKRMNNMRCLTAAVCLVSACLAHAQFLYDTSGVKLCRFDGQYYASDVKLGRFDGTNVFDEEGRAIGRTDGEVVLFSNGVIHGRIDSGSAYDYNGTLLGRLQGNVFYSPDGKKTGQIDGVPQLAAILFYFFFIGTTWE